MSLRLYDSGVQFYKNKGGHAKLHGEQKHLDNPPSVLGNVFEQVEHIPDVHVHRVQPKFHGWRDMESDEIKAMDAWLRMKLGPPKKNYE